MRNKLILFCLFFSGFAGLAYELMWTRLLSFSFGSTTLSFSTVLAVFFGGLAMGAFFAGKRSARLARPLRTYAWIELGCGVAGLLLYPILKNLGSLFASFDPGPNLFGMLVRFFVSVPLLLIPTLLMGATLPIVCAGVIDEDDEVGRGTALIYGINTLGACIGAYLVTYHLLHAFGVFGSNMIAVAANVIAGGAALLIDRTASVPRERKAAAATPAAESAEDAVEMKKWIAVASVLTALGGFGAISLQIVWIRLFSSILRGTIYGIGAVLISVLIGIAIGSIFISRTLKTTRHPVLWFCGFQLATILSVVWFCSSLEWIEYVLHGINASRGDPMVVMHTQLLITFVVLLVPTFASGASLPLLLQIVERRAENTGRSLGALYAANTAGSILGSLLTGFIAVPEAGSEATLFASLVTLAAVAAIAALLLGKHEPLLLRAVAAIAAIFAVSAYPGLDVRALSNGRPQSHVTYAQWQKDSEKTREELRYFAEGEHANVAVNESDINRALVLNGLGQGSRSFAPPHYVLESVLVAYVPFVHAPAKNKAMLVGLGAGVSADLFVHLGVEKLVVVELEPRVADAVNVIFEPNSPLKSERVELVLNDARHQLLMERNQGGGNYDLITSMPAHPWVASSIFTREFFEIAKDNLNAQGIFCTWFGSGRMDDLAVQSLMRAFTDVFPYYVAYYVEEVAAYYLVGSKAQFHLDLARVEEMQKHPAISAQRFFSNPRALPLRTYASGTPDTPKPAPGIVNSDDSAFVETHSPRSSTRSPMLSEFMPREYFVPELIVEEKRPQFYDALLEDLVGERIPRAKRTLAAVKNILPEGGADYFGARLALAEGKRDEARATLEKLREGGGAYADRAAKYHALSLPDRSPEQLDALALLKPTTENILLLLDRDRPRALTRLDDTAPPDPATDATRWLLYASKHGLPQLRAAFLRHVGPMLQRTSSRALLTIALELANAHGLTAEAKYCQRRLASLDSAEAQSLTRAGIRAGAAGRFKEAAEILGRAQQIDASSGGAQTLRVRALVEIGDRAELDRELERLRFYGHSEEYLAWLVQEAESKKLGSKLLEKSREQPADEMVEDAGGRDPN